jgi:hypothetical protein
MSSSAHYSQTPWAYSLPPMWGTKFHTHAKKKARFLLSNSFVSAKWTLVMSVTLVSKILSDNVSPFHFSTCSLHNQYPRVHTNCITLHIRACPYHKLSYLAHVPQYTHTYTIICYSVWQYITKLYKYCSISPMTYSFNLHVLYWQLKFTQLLSCHQRNRTWQNVDTVMFIPSFEK